MFSKRNTSFYRKFDRQPLETKQGVQWLSVRVLGLRWRVCGFKPHLRHCIVSLSKTFILCVVLVKPRKTPPDMTEKMLLGYLLLNCWTESNQICLVTCFTTQVGLAGIHLSFAPPSGALWGQGGRKHGNL